MDCRFAGWTRGGERKSHTLENSAECVLALLVRFTLFPAFLSAPSLVMFAELLADMGRSRDAPHPPIPFSVSYSLN
jgi:hypothetical protein